MDLDTFGLSIVVGPPARAARPEALDQLRSLVSEASAPVSARLQMCPVCGATSALADLVCGCGHDFRTEDKRQYQPWESAPARRSWPAKLIKPLVTLLTLAVAAGAVTLGAKSFARGLQEAAVPSPVRTSLMELAAAQDSFAAATGAYTTDLEQLEPQIIDAQIIDAQIYIATTGPDGYCIQATSSTQTWHYRSVEEQIAAGGC